MDSRTEKIKATFGSIEVRMLLAAAVILLVFGTVNSRFFSANVWKAILLAAGDIGFLAIGQAIVIAVREIDLSVASVWALCAYLFAVMANSGINALLALIIILAIGALIGCANGLLRVRTGIPSFLTTIASMWIVRGLVYIIDPNSYTYLKITQSILLDVWKGSVGIIPDSFLWVAFFAVIFTLLLTRTKFGNHVLAVGGNPTVARNVGVRVERTKILSFMLCSLMAAFGGAVMIVEYEIMTPVAGLQASFGAGLEFEAIAVCLIGGVSLLGGRASFPALFVAIVTYASLKSGLILIGLPGYWYIPCTGVAIFVFVLLHRIGRKGTRSEVSYYIIPGNISSSTI